MIADKRFHQAVKWAYVMNWGEKGVSVVVTFVLASMLGPNEFGLVALAMIYIGFIQVFLEQGLVSAIIQRRDLADYHVDSVFWATMTLSVVLLLCSTCFAGWWANANHTPSLLNVICVLSLAIPIEGFSIVPRALLLRSMDFKKLSIRSNTAVLLGGAVGLTMAVLGCGAWALVGQRICQDVVNLCLLWRLSHWRPQLRFSVRGLRELLCFSSGNFLSKLSVFANTYCGALILGISLGPAAVGIYRLAERLMGVVLDLTTSTLQAVSLPQLSRFQDDPVQLRRSVETLVWLSSMVAFPLLAIVASTSATLMRLLGPKWVPASGVIRVLCISGIITSLVQFVGPLLQAISRPVLAAMVTWGNTFVSVGLLVAAARFLHDSPTQNQVLGVAFVRVTADVLYLAPLLFIVLRRFCGMAPLDVLGIVRPSVMLGISVGAVALTVSATQAGGMSHPAATLVMAGLFGSTSGLTVLYFIDRAAFWSVVSLCRVWQGPIAASEPEY